jgi:uncharacterized membrane protein HdeD (DUF308 family)
MRWIVIQREQATVGRRSMGDMEARGYRPFTAVLGVVMLALGLVFLCLGATSIESYVMMVTGVIPSHLAV